MKNQMSRKHRGNDREVELQAGTDESRKIEAMQTILQAKAMLLQTKAILKLKLGKNSLSSAVGGRWRRQTAVVQVK